MQPAKLDPTKFLDVFNSTSDSAEVLRTDLMTSHFKVTSQDTLYPLLFIQFIADAFLSTQ